MKRRRLYLLIATGLLLFALACSPFLVIPTMGLQAIGENFGGLIMTGNYDEFCFILTEEVVSPYLPWWNPWAQCDAGMMQEALDDDLAYLTPDGVGNLSDDYSSWDGLDEYFQMLIDDYNLSGTIDSPHPPTPVYEGPNLPAPPPFHSDGLTGDGYFIYSFAGPAEPPGHSWGAYCLAFETNDAGRPAISDIRLGCCYGDFTACDDEACEACPGAPHETECSDEMLQEAEDGTLGGDFEIGDDSDASGGQYVFVDSDEDGASEPGDSFVSFCFDVPSEGTYSVRAAVHADNGDENSFFVRIDGSPADGYLWDIPEGSGWPHDYVGDRDGDDPVEVDLSEGQHTVTIYLREAGAQLDTVELQ